MAKIVVPQEPMELKDEDPSESTATAAAGS